MAKRMKLVLVDWLDACSPFNKWRDRDKPLLPSLMRTAGWLLFDEEDHVTIAGTHGGDVMGEMITIPRGCIKRMRNITPKGLKVE